MTRPIPYGEVCIAITAYNRSAHTRRTIESIWKHAECDFTLCVVDNSSTDDTWEVLSELCEKGLIHFAYRFTKNMGPAVATNYMWSQFTAPYYLRLDNDIFFSKNGWLNEMSSLIEKDENISVLSYPIFGTASKYKTASGQQEKDLLERTRHSVSHPGGLFFAKGNHFNEIGWWNEDYGSYGAEDGDYSLRIDLLGKQRWYINDFNWGTHDDIRCDTREKYQKSKNIRQKSHQQYGGLFQINNMMYQFKLRSLRVSNKYIPRTKGDEVSFTLNKEYSTRITKTQSDIRKALKFAEQSNIEIDRINRNILVKLVKCSTPGSLINTMDGSF